MRKAIRLTVAPVLAIVMLLGSCARNDRTDGGPVVDRDGSTFQYMIDHYPSREQMQQVRDCITARTGFQFEPLPEDFGPQMALNPPVDYVDQARRASSSAVNQAHVDCVFELGLEDNFFPPGQQEAIRNSKNN